jgi:hypothetical protein
MNWYEAIMALSSLLDVSNTGDLFSRVADHSQTQRKSEQRKFLQNDNKYKHPMPERHYQMLIFCHISVTKRSAV